MLFGISYFSALGLLVRMVEFQDDRSASHPDGDDQGQYDNQCHARNGLAILTTDKERGGPIGNISRDQGSENGQHKDDNRSLVYDT